MEQIVSGVHLLAGWPKYWFNVYLVEDVLIDGGTRWARRRVLRQLEGKSLSMTALTHCHPDHQGAVREVCERFEVPLACHEADAPAMEGKEPMQPAHALMRFGELAWAGPPRPVDRILHEGDEIAGFRVVDAPGHTPGHVMFYRPSDRAVIAGDVLANIHFSTNRPGLREPPKPFSFDPEENRRSIQKLCDLKPSVVCFGHGPPLRQMKQLAQFGQRLLDRSS